MKYAHSLSGNNGESSNENDWQTLDAHLEGVAQIASNFARNFDSAEWAHLVGWLHDIGKEDDSFQVYLRRENGLDDGDYDSSGDGKVNHSSAGAALAEEKWGRCAGRAIAYIIAGHHAGLPDWLLYHSNPQLSKINSSSVMTNFLQQHRLPS